MAEPDPSDNPFANIPFLGDIAKAKQLLVFDQMPMIGIGKIDRAQISQRAQEEFNG